ncbi:alpha/beta hydrolase [Aspergillus stella-maris]|uniref:alpha/beta hydrolase n=1 Tax=Aspergillus stella-maris TaxID=1810926 RepID=UPI003CCDA0C7
MLCRLALAAYLLLPALVQGGAASASNNSAPSEALHRREFFYVGGEYVNTTDGWLFHNQMYVEKLSPQGGASQPYPIVILHGGAQTGTNFLNKPDGGRGWASWFMEHGYEVYIADRTTTARSPTLPEDGYSTSAFSAEFIAQRFTNVQGYPLWPQAKLHSQWPGTGERGDEIFDTYYASNVQSISDSLAQEQTMKAAGEALLDKIGPVVLITHSQGGLYGWSWTDSRPDLIKALIQIEPKGPPFREVIFSNTFSRAYGLTSIPLTYDPKPMNQSTPLAMKTIPSEKPGELLECIIQQEPARQLPNLAKVPIAIDTGEASYHAQYDYCFIKFLKQAGVHAEHLDLGKRGIHGNAHLQFLEKNSDDIAALLHEWIGNVTLKA